MLSLPTNVRKTLALWPPCSQPSLRDIKHMVLLMQENRSFDYCFGTMAGVADRRSRQWTIKLKSKLFRDHLHPSNAGYKALADALDLASHKRQEMLMVSR